MNHIKKNKTRYRKPTLYSTIFAVISRKEQNKICINKQGKTSSHNKYMNKMSMRNECINI